MKPGDERISELLHYIIAESDEPLISKAARKIRDIIQPPPESEEERIERETIEWLQALANDVLPNKEFGPRAKWILAKLGHAPKRMVKRVEYGPLRSNNCIDPLYRTKEEASRTYDSFIIARVEWEEPE